MSLLEADPGTRAADDKPFIMGAWGKTVKAVQGFNARHPDRFVPPDQHAPNGYYQDPSRPGERFPIIGRDNDVNGGVYIGEGSREIILVEAKKQKEEKGSLEGLYEWVKVSLSVLKNLKPKWGEQEIIEAVYKMISERMKYDSQEVNRLTADKNDQIVPLEEFLEKGVGVCRHQSLTGSYLLQRLKKDGVLPEGVQISSDRNKMFGGGHAWVRITLSNGEVMIMDAAQGYCGLLKDAGEKSRGWVYDRPEDIEEDLEGEEKKVHEKVEGILELTGYKKTKDLTVEQEIISTNRVPVLVGFEKSLFRIEKIDGKWMVTNLSSGFKGLAKTLEPSEYGKNMTFGRYARAASGPAFQSSDHRFSREHFTISFQEDSFTITTKSEIRGTEIWEKETKKKDVTPIPEESEEEIRVRVAEEMFAMEYKLLVSLPPRIEGREILKETIKNENSPCVGYGNNFFDIKWSFSDPDGWIIKNVASGAQKLVKRAEFGKPFVFGRAAKDPALQANDPHLSREHFSITFQDHDFTVSALSTKKPTEIWVHRERAFSAKILDDQAALDSFAREFGEELKKEMQMKREIGVNFPEGFAGQLEFVRAYAQQFLEEYSKTTELIMNESGKELIRKALPSKKELEDDDIGLLAEFFVAQYTNGKFGFF